MKLKSADLISALEVAYERLGITMSAEEIRGIKMEAEAGYFLIFAEYLDGLRALDGVGAVDGMVFEFFKALTDNPTVAEVATFEFFKNVGDIVDFSDADQITKDFRRPVSDIANIEDPISKHTGKPIQEFIASLEDSTFLFTKKVREDTVGGADQINTKDFGKNVEDTPAAADQINNKDVTKPLTDASTVSEFYTPNFGKITTDSASFDDSDIRLFGKNEVETVDTTDDDVLHVGKNVEEEPSVADDYVSAYNKPLADSVFFTDDVDGTASILDDQEMQFRKNTADAFSVSESFFRQVDFDRDFTETPAASDEHRYDFGKPLAHSASASESHTTNLSKPLNETPAAADAIIVDTDKPLSDSLAATEQLVKDLTKAPFSDSSSVTDDNTIAFGKVPSDLASLTDAGSLRSQGYCDFTYFAEDYVGASRTF